MKISSKNLVLIFLIGMLSFSVSAQVVRITTNLGNIDIELNPEVAPNTVENFLNYVNRGDYNASIIHRIADNSETGANFIIQGGGFHQREELLEPIPADDAIVNEFSLLNLRGTISMAKVSGQPDSATSQWFINTTDNPSLDDVENSGGFTVFGQVINGMEIVDLIGSLRPWVTAGGGGLNSIPLLSYPGEGLVYEYAVQISDFALYEESLNINAGLNGAWYNLDTSGQGILVEVLPASDLVFMAWFTFDSVAPPSDAEAVVGAAEHRWLTGLGVIDHDTNSITFNLVLTTGGLFDNPQEVTNSAEGTYGAMTISFTDCSHATVTYNLIDQALSGSFPMVRISSDNVALCESLSQQ